MSTDYKLNKSELTRLARQQKLYEHYLPVLKQKQEQLELEHYRISKTCHEATAKRENDLHSLSPYIALFADEYEVSLIEIVRVKIESASKIFAGIKIDVLRKVSFTDPDLPYFQTAPWLIHSLPLIRAYLASEIKLRFLREEDRLIKRELRRATQKVNLFDKVLLPKTKAAMKRIKIALGDEEVAMVTRGKIAKAKQLEVKP
jgi:V/A-type H+-transporting ATPase subunit D